MTRQANQGRVQAGFGLIEILVVIVIIALLAIFLLPRLTGKSKDPTTGKQVLAPVERARQVAGNAYIAQINEAILMYKTDHENQNPPDLKALKSYGVNDEMTIDPNTKQPLPYDPQTGTVSGGDGSGATGLPRVGNF